MKKIEPWLRFAETVLIPPIAVGFNWRFEGLEQMPQEGPVPVAANHVSYFDPLAHGRFVEKAGRRPRFLAKIELYKNPLVRAVLQGASQIPVRRGSGDHAPVDEALRALEEGKVVVVYPESTVTTNEDFSPMEGKTGIARLALASRVPVLPVAVWGSQRVWQRSGARSLKFGRPIWLKAGTPIDFSAEEEGLEDRATLRRVTDRVTDELAVLVEDLRSRYPKRWS
jgi:1-acyl-sn-glycerol-3-phosphate acyltransferase